MNEQLTAAARQVIARYALSSLEDVMALIPRYMCHVLQESDQFGTYPPNVVKLKFDAEQWDVYIQRYEHYRDVVIPGISPLDYLNAMLNEGPRLPCFCSEMASVAGVLVSQLLGQKVYAVRNIFVNYLYLPQRWHCINALIQDNRIRYFDASAYAQVLDKKRRKIVEPSQLPGFNAADIDEAFIHSDRWLQNEPFARRIELVSGQLLDNYYPSPVHDKPVDEFQRVYG